MDPVEQAIKSYIVEMFLFGQGGDELDREDSLLERGIVDSTGVLEIVSFLEEQWGLGVADEELVPENFDSIAHLTEFVNKKRAVAAPAAEVG